MTHDEIMASARHLSAHQMAVAFNDLTRGIDWRGCSKGHIAEEFASARQELGQRLGDRIKDGGLFLRLIPRGDRFGTCPEDVPAIQALIVTKEVELKAEPHNVWLMRELADLKKALEYAQKPRTT